MPYQVVALSVQPDPVQNLKTHCSPGVASNAPKLPECGKVVHWPGVTCPLKMKFWVQAPSGVIAKVTGELLRFSASTSGVGEAVAKVAKAASALARTLMDTFPKVSKASVKIEFLVFTMFSFEI